MNVTENETLNYENSTFSPSAQQNGYDLFIESQRNLDRSLSVLNTVATLIAIMVAILAIFIAAAAYLGLLEPHFDS